MPFQMTGLAPEPFQPLFQMDDEALRAKLALRRVADSKPGFPCRVSLEDADPGENLILLNYESLSAPTPYQTRYAIYVREAATMAATYTDDLAPVLRNRPIALRFFDKDGLLAGADLGRNEDLVAKIRAGFSQTHVAFMHAHNAMHGCFAVRIDRMDEN